MSSARDLVISYGTFDSNDSGASYEWQLTGVPALSQDERDFTFTFDVVVRGTSASNLRTAVGAAIDAWNTRHQVFKVVYAGTTYYHFVDGTGTVAAGEEGAEFIQASWRILGSHHTTLTRLYRVTVKVTRAANQPGKPGLLSQSIRVTTAPNGLREMRYSAVFTPGPTDSETGTAQERYEDATYGFDARVTAIQTVLTGTWERQGATNVSYEEDSRTLRASATYQELIFPQSASATNDPELINARYDVRVERRSGLSVPGAGLATPMSAVTVNFSTAVVTTQTDLNAVIEDKVIPYVTSNLATSFGGNTPILLRHGLKADPVHNRIAGTLMYLVTEGTTLEISRRTTIDGNTGDSYMPVLDGTKWTRDRHTGPGSLSKRVILAARVIGQDPAFALDAMEERTVQDNAANNFHLVGWGTAYSVSKEDFGIYGGNLTTTVETRVLQFVYAEVRDTTPDSAVQGSARGSSGGSRVQVASGLGRDRRA